MAQKVEISSRMEYREDRYVSHDTQKSVSIRGRRWVVAWAGNDNQPITNNNHNILTLAVNIEIIEVNILF